MPASSMSPDIIVNEQDFTLTVPAVSSTVAATAGMFAWGPVLSPYLLSNEQELVDTFGYPSDWNAKHWFTASDVLAYGKALYVNRASLSLARNSISGGVENTVSLTGTVSFTAGSATVTGVGTAFTTETPVGTVILYTINSVQYRTTVKSVASTTSMTVDIAALATATGIGASKVTSISVGTAITGTVSFTAGSTAVVGVGTSFTTALVVGDMLAYVVGGKTYTAFVKTITDNLNIVLETAASATAAGTTVRKVAKAVVNNASDYSVKSSVSLAAMGQFVAKYPGALGNSISVSIADASSYAVWAYKGLFQSAPGTSDYCSKFYASANDEVHIVVVDSLGLWTGVPGTVLETFGYASKASDATGFGGASTYYKNVINTSKYVWWASHPTTGVTGSGLDLGTAAQSGVDYKTIALALNYQLNCGTDGGAYTDGELQIAYDQFRNEDIYDISLIAIGSEKAAVAAYVTSNVAEPRMDVIVFLSPQLIADGSPIIGDSSTEATNTVAYRTAMNLSSSYMFIDSGWYYRYDKYNDIYRWVPLSGSTCGIKIRSDMTSDVWKSPAGLNRGQYKNVVRLAMNPNKAMRDILFSANINPVVAFPNQGVVLFGDKTGLNKPSAFDMISVRSLFIMLEKAIKRAARFQLFENNTPFTRAQFRSYIEPYLRDIKGREGVNDFKVVCDETNNTPSVISRNEFVGTILIKPQYSIRVMYLNFSAVRQDVSFSEIQGNV